MADYNGQDRDCNKTGYCFHLNEVRNMIKFIDSDLFLTLIFWNIAFCTQMLLISQQLFTKFLLTASPCNYNEIGLGLFCVELWGNKINKLCL